MLMVKVVEEIKRISVQGIGLDVILIWRTAFEGGPVILVLNHRVPFTR